MGLRFTMTRNAVWSLWNIRFTAKPAKRALRTTTDSCPSSPSKIERLFAGEITWTLLVHGRRSLANESGRTRSAASGDGADPTGGVDLLSHATKGKPRRR